MNSLYLLTLACCVAYVSAHGYEIHYNKTLLSLKRGRSFFKIVQFADLHYANGKHSDCKDLSPEWAKYLCSDLNSTALESRVLDIEKPDLVIFMGDNIMGGETTNPRMSLQAILAPLKKRKIPHMMILGEHDDEVNQTSEVVNFRRELMKIDREDPLSLSKYGLSDIYGIGNYGHGVLDSEGNPTHHLYLMDSSSYDTTGATGGFDWIRSSQINWYNLTSHNRTMDLNKTLPGLLFHHIPSPEYELAWHCSKATESKPVTFTGFGSEKLPDGYTSASGIGLFAGFDSCMPGKTTDRCVGVKQEGVHSPMVNSGLFSTILDRNEIKMVNVAHDHLNDYCCPLGNTGVQHCYAGGLGYHGYGKEGYSRRARVIRLYPNGKIDTYFRLDKSSKPSYKKVQEQVIYDPTS